MADSAAKARYDLALRAAAELELRRRAREVAAVSAGFDPLAPDPEMGFREWCEALAARGLRVDGKPFRLDNRPALAAIYDLIPTHPQDARDRMVVLMKGAQMGLTLWEILADLYMAIKWKPVTIGLYVPDMKLAAYKSEHRFMRIARTIPGLPKAMAEPPAGGTRKRGEGNTLTRTLLESIFLFLWTSGKAMTESFPADVVSFDEVQGMAPDDISRTRERMSASEVRFTLLLSTPKWPDADIHFWYQRGTQHEFNTRCDACGALSVLSQHFPKCLRLDEGPGHYICPTCEARIADPQVGEWRPTFPERAIESYHLSQILSPTVTPAQLLEEWQLSQTGKQRQNYYNRKLGLPYVDPTQIPVTLAHLQACVAAGAAVGLRWQARASSSVMGIDQMGGFNAVLIKGRLPDGRQALLHAEAIFDEDPFARCDALMDLYGVEACVVEGLPNWNDAKRFANRHPGRVFVASYGDQEDTQTWGDQIARTDRKTATEARDRYTVRLNQYKAMQAATARLAQGQCLFPDPQGLECDYRDGPPRRVLLLRDIVFEHLTHVALVSERDPETGRWRTFVQKIGMDPHFAYANMLCDVAWVRGTGGTFMLTEKPAELALQDSLRERLPGIDPLVLRKVQPAPEGTCGRCEAFPQGEDRGRCTARGLVVLAGDVACPMYVGVE